MTLEWGKFHISKAARDFSISHGLALQPCPGTPAMALGCTCTQSGPSHPPELYRLGLQRPCLWKTSPSPHKHEANQSGTYLTPPGRQKPWALCSLSQRACPSSSFPPAQAGPENTAQKTALLQLEGQRGPRPTGTGGRWSPVPNPYFLTLTFASQSTRPPETGAGGVGGDNTVTDIQNLPA